MSIPEGKGKSTKISSAGYNIFEATLYPNLIKMLLLPFFTQFLFGVI